MIAANAAGSGQNPVVNQKVPQASRSAGDQGVARPSASPAVRGGAGRRSANPGRGGYPRHAGAAGASLRRSPLPCSLSRAPSATKGASESIRANAHMRHGGESYASSRCKAGLLKSIMDRWRVPKFEILDTAPTHLTSLISETLWARRFVWLGYELANKWPEHRTAAPPRGLLSVPEKRLWNLTAAEAIEDEVSLRLECLACDLHQAVELPSLRPETPLRRLRSLRLACPSCGAALLRINRPEMATWRWGSYQPKPMSSQRR